MILIKDYWLLSTPERAKLYLEEGIGAKFLRDYWDCNKDMADKNEMPIKSLKSVPIISVKERQGSLFLEGLPEGGLY
jgi:chaperone required for assembly of F1-ATPase